MDKIAVTTLGLGLIGFIYWFFFGKKPSFAKATEGQGRITIIVEGGYKPNVIQIPKDKPVDLTFIRKDENSCLEELYFPDYKIKEYLPMNVPVTITLHPPHSTKSGFHCGMNMFHGRIEIAK